MTNTRDWPAGTAPRDAWDLGSALAAHPLFANIEGAALASISNELEWFSLPGGWTLFREGEPADALYLVTSGCLAAAVRQGDGSQAAVAQICAGETVGEMALISGEPRSATVVAVRDSSLLRMTKQNFDSLIKRYPAAMFHLAKVLVSRLVHTTHTAHSPTAPKTIALVPLEPCVACCALAQSLADRMAEAGMRTCLLDLGVADRTAEWFHALEHGHDVILYRAEYDASPWTQLCLRQADRILLVARSQLPSRTELPFEPLLTTEPQRPCDLVFVHDKNAQSVQYGGTWFTSLSVDMRCQLRLGNRNDVARLARLLTGRTVSLVLSSGGARGFAHLGVIRALREAEVPIDVVGGASMGAIIAAGAALEWDDAELESRMRHAFVTTNPMNDYTFPVIALAKGRKVTRLLQHHFGELNIEELWRPYFCVSSNLTTADTRIHRSGPLWRALRASVAIPGLLPPVIENGEVLVDGGVIDGFPVGAMRAMQRGRVIGVNVTTDRALTSVSEHLEKGSLWWFLRHHHRNAPGIVSLLMRAGTVSSDSQKRLYREQADLLLEPPIEELDLLDWKAFSRAIELGYQHTIERLEQLKMPLFAP